MHEMHDRGQQTWIRQRGDWVRNCRRRMNSASCIRGSEASVPLRWLVPIAALDSSAKVKCTASGAILCTDRHRKKAKSDWLRAGARNFLAWQLPRFRDFDFERRAIWRKRKGHPATGRPSLQGRIVPTEAKPSKLSAQILGSRKTPCQVISRT